MLRPEVAYFHFCVRVIAIETCIKGREVPGSVNSILSTVHAQSWALDYETKTARMSYGGAPRPLLC